MPGSCRGTSGCPDLPLRTERLVLRPFTPEDEDSLYAFHSDPDAVRYVPYSPRTREQVAEVLLRKMSNIALRQEGDLLELAVTLADDRTVIGDVLLALRSVAHQTLEVGYIFAPAAGGRGYATEAVRALVDLAFDPIGAPPDRSPASTPATSSSSGAAGAARVPARGASGRERVVQGRADERAGLRLLSREWPAWHELELVASSSASVTAGARPARPAGCGRRTRRPAPPRRGGRRPRAAGRARRPSPRPRSAPSPPRSCRPARSSRRRWSPWPRWRSAARRRLPAQDGGVVAVRLGHDLDPGQVGRRPARRCG